MSRRDLIIRSEPETNLEHLLGNGARKKDGYLYPVWIEQRPVVVNIANVAITTDNWTAVPTVAISGVLSWRLSERDGNDFYYAYDSSPTAYSTAFGVIQRDTELTQLYVKRLAGAGTLNMQLEWWS